MDNDTIAAIVTAYGAAGVGIIRISGAAAAFCAEQVFQSKSGQKISAQGAYRLAYGYIRDEAGKIIDEALALTMWAPKSFTGENVVELQCHGGITVLKKVLALVLKAGARLAHPGEFSQRAFLNGRLDLSQAEAIMALINAKTDMAVDLAVQHLQGGLSAEIKQYRQTLLELVASLEADLDFPEEDFVRLEPAAIVESLCRLEKGLAPILKSFTAGRIRREGLQVALVGKPNVGKSSLFNTLLRTKRAIVTDIPGTTRDTIEEYYNLAGLPLLLIDTAGVRKPQDPVEEMGVQRTKEVVAQADLLLYILDLKEGLTAADREFLEQLPPGKVLVIGNKVDLVPEQENEIKEEWQRELSPYRFLLISAAAEKGIAELAEAIKEMCLAGEWDEPEGIFLLNLRQKAALENALGSLKEAREGLQADLPQDLVLLELKNGLDYLGQITGETVDEEIIGQIFSQFCLGK